MHKRILKAEHLEDEASLEGTVHADISTLSENHQTSNELGPEWRSISRRGSMTAIQAEISPLPENSNETRLSSFEAGLKYLHAIRKES
jgi:hypothetical protein